MQITNRKIITLIKDKDELVKSGRAVSNKIEKIEAKIAKCEARERVLTEKVQPKELGEEAEKLKAEINKMIKKFEKIASEITKIKLDSIPADLEKEHKDLMTEREKLERDRNKIALKVQKVKDKVVPLIQKEIKPHLKEFEDMETADLKGEILDIKIFSHLEEFKKSFKAKNK